jgi:zinc protease
VERDLKEMQEALVTPGELQQARAMLLREIPLSESSVSGIAAGMIARTVAGLPLDEPTRAAQRYVKLSAGEVQAAYRKWIRPGDFVQVTEGPNPH